MKAPRGNEGTHLERQETQLWRVSLWFLVLLGVGLGAMAWERLSAGDLGGWEKTLAGLPAGVVVLAALFAVYVWQKKRELAELRGFVRGMQARAEAPATVEQVEQLADILRKSQEGYRDLIDSFEDSVFALGLDGTIRAANREFAELIGQPFSELVGRRLSEFVEEPPLEDLVEGREEGGLDESVAVNAKPALRKFIERRHWSGVVRIKLRSKPEPRYYECVLHAIVKGGEVVGAAGLARDVTEQRQSEARFTELFETLQEGVYFTTPDGKLLDANPALVKMLGYASKEELLATNVTDLYANPQDRQQAIGELEEKTRINSREIVLKHKDGRLVRCLDTSAAIRGASGAVERYQGTLVDVTEKREMEERLHREQEFARRLVESFPDLIVVLDREGKYTYVSPRSEETLGYKPEELVGQKLGERSDAEDLGAIQQLFNELVNGQRGLGSLEYRTRHKDGSWRVFRATASPLWDESEKVIGVIAAARDVTEVKRLEEQVIQSEKLAAMGQMIAGVTHELNNPLTAILGIADLLKEELARSATADPSLASGGTPAKPDGNEKVRKQLDLMHQQARRASEIVQNLLAYARPKTGKKAKVELGDLVRRALALHEYAMRVNNIRVDFQPGPAYYVEGDTNQLMQVFLNLLINAEQAITADRPQPSHPSPASPGNIRVRLGERDEHYWVEFEDDGPGIAMETLPKIFDPFFTTKRPGRGTGLGLSICLAIVKEHGGTIEVESPPMALLPSGTGQARGTKSGTVFRVVLPTFVRPDDRRTSAGKPTVSERSHGVRDQEPGAEKIKKPAIALQADEKLQARRILVVDDEESIRELVREGLLRHAGDAVSVDCAASAEEALEMLREAAAQRSGVRNPMDSTGVQKLDSGYDVVFCDLKMPGIGGHRLFEASKSVCGEGTTPSFVFMTGDVADPETQEFLRSSLSGSTQPRTAGADPGGSAGCVLLKPFRMADLVAALGRALEAAPGDPPTIPPGGHTGQR